MSPFVIHFNHRKVQILQKSTLVAKYHRRTLALAVQSQRQRAAAAVDQQGTYRAPTGHLAFYSNSHVRNSHTRCISSKQTRHPLQLSIWTTRQTPHCLSTSNKAVLKIFYFKRKQYNCTLLQQIHWYFGDKKYKKNSPSEVLIFTLI